MKDFSLERMAATKAAKAQRLPLTIPFNSPILLFQRRTQSTTTKSTATTEKKPNQIVDEIIAAAAAAANAAKKRPSRKKRTIMEEEAEKALQAELSSFAEEKVSSDALIRAAYQPNLSYKEILEKERNREPDYFPAIRLAFPEENVDAWAIDRLEASKQLKATRSDRVKRTLHKKRMWHRQLFRLRGHRLRRKQTMEAKLKRFKKWHQNWKKAVARKAIIKQQELELQQKQQQQQQQQQQ